MVLGTLPNVRTTVAKIRANVRRGLNYKGADDIKLLRPDAADPDGFTEVLVLTTGFTRSGVREEESLQGHSVVFTIVDTTLDGTLPAALRTKELHVEFQNEIFMVTHVPLVPPDAAQVYTIYCGTRTLRRSFYNNARR